MTLYKKKICIISSSRAEFGILKNLLVDLKNDKNFKTQLVALDDHQLVEGKKIVTELKEVNIKKIHKINLKKSFKSTKDIIHRSHVIMKHLSSYFEKKKIDLLIVLGDRYEIFISTYAAVLHKVPIAHLSGGDETLGSYDNQFRHAISKLSNFHFVTNKFSKKRLEKMGEPKKAHKWGEPNREKLEEPKEGEKFGNRGKGEGDEVGES